MVTAMANQGANLGQCLGNPGVPMDIALGVPLGSVLGPTAPMHALQGR